MNDLCLYRLVVATAFFVSSSPFDSFRMDRRTRVVNDALKWWGEKLLRTIRYNCCCPIRLLTLNAFFSARSMYRPKSPRIESVK